MEINEYLSQVANIVPSRIPGDDGKVYISKFDHSYITRVGMEGDIKFLADLGITEELTHGVGFSLLHKKWFGWSHRAVAGFGVGSTCKKGDVHYKPANLEDTIEDAINFWADDYHTNVRASVVGDTRIFIEWDNADTTPNPELRGKVSGVYQPYNPDNFGRGEWVAETMEDAKQMAIDFHKNVA